MLTAVPEKETKDKRYKIGKILHFSGITVVNHPLYYINSSVLFIVASILVRNFILFHV